MKRKYFRTNEDLSKILNDITQATIKCSCGHSVLIPQKQNKFICSWCGNYVFRTKEEEFKYRMKEKLLKEKRNEKNDI